LFGHLFWQAVIMQLDRVEIGDLLDAVITKQSVPVASEPDQKACEMRGPGDGIVIGGEVRAPGVLRPDRKAGIAGGWVA
jgi:hypothetical protein